MLSDSDVTIAPQLPVSSSDRIECGFTNLFNRHKNIQTTARVKHFNIYDAKFLEIWDISYPFPVLWFQKYHSPAVLTYPADLVESLVKRKERM